MTLGEKIASEARVWHGKHGPIARRRLPSPPPPPPAPPRAEGPEPGLDLAGAAENLGEGLQREVREVLGALLHVPLAAAPARDGEMGRGQAAGARPEAKGPTRPLGRAGGNLGNRGAGGAYRESVGLRMGVGVVDAHRGFVDSARLPWVGGWRAPGRPKLAARSCLATCRPAPYAVTPYTVVIGGQGTPPPGGGGEGPSGKP